MKSFLLSMAVMMMAAAGFLHASDWTTDYKAALKAADAQDKLVLLDFTGSDWCEFCQLLDKDVLSQPEFRHYAARTYILVKVDFPRAKQLPEEVKNQNDALGKKFGVGGYPTLIVLTPDGREAGRIVGYKPGSGLDAVMAKLRTFNIRKE
jgi:protein disulfide-isomerase